MLEWITQNYASLIVLAAVATVIILVVVKMFKDKKQGKTSCSGGCSGCAIKNSCHAHK